MTADTPPTSGDSTPTAPETSEGSQTIEIPLADFGDAVPAEGDEVKLTIISVDQNAGVATAEISKSTPPEQAGIKGAASQFDQTEQQ